MAQVIQRVWRSGPRRIKRVAYGYTFQDKDGKQIRKTDATWTREYAEKAMAAALLDLTQPATAPASPVVTFKAMTERYLKEKEAAKKKSIRADRAIVGKLLAFFGADTPLTDITGPRIAEYRLMRQTAISERTKRELGHGSINRELSIMRALMNMAASEDFGFIKQAPKVKLLKEPQGRLRYLNQDEATRLLEECRKAAEYPNVGQRSPGLYPFAVIALSSGMRKNEILNLTWADVDLSRGVFKLELTKAGTRREVQMTLAAYRVVAELPRKGPRLFGRSIRTAWEGAVERAGIKNFRLHDMRHTAASWLVQKGRSLKEVSELLGHSSVTMSQRYAHLGPEHLKAAISVLDDFFSTTPAQEADGAAKCPPTLTGA